MSEADLILALARSAAAIFLAAVAIVIAWKGHGGDYIVVALVALLASCTVLV